MQSTASRTRTTRVTLMALLLLWGSAAARAGFDVDILYDNDADFSTYTTYRWTTSPPSDSPVGRMVDETIKATVARALAEKGLQPAPEGRSPDLLLTYHGMVEDDLLIEGVRYELAPHVVWTGAAPMAVTRSRRLGTLILDFADAETETVVWSGVVHGSARNTTKLRKKIGPALEKMLRRYPPERD